MFKKGKMIMLVIGFFYIDEWDDFKIFLFKVNDLINEISDEIKEVI